MMPKRFYIGDVLDVATGEADLENRMARAMRDLADELNSGLDEHEVVLEHLDSSDFLTFRPRQPAAD